MKKFLLPLISLCVTAAVAITAYFILIHLQKPRKADVLVAKDDIPSGTVIDNGLIASIPWEGKKIPEGFIDVGTMDKVLNRVAAVDIVRGSPICEASLAPKGSPAGLFAKIPEGMRAMTVKVDEVSGVAGFSRPGSRVDVLLAGTDSSLEGKEKKSSKIILQNVLVLAAGQRITQLEGKDKPQAVNTVTLLLPPVEAEKLALATKMGTLLLTLRAGGDTVSVKTKGSLPDDVWGVTVDSLTAAIVEIIQGGVKTQIKLEEKNVEGDEKLVKAEL